MSTGTGKVLLTSTSLRSYPKSMQIIAGANSFSILEDRSYDDTHHRLALHYGRYLCRAWSGKQPDLPTLSKFVIYFQTEPTPPPGGEKEVSTRQVWNHDCLG